MFGQLGNNTTTTNQVPENISMIQGSSLIDRHIVEIACGNGHALALDNNSQVHAWGCNDFSQLGYNTTQKTISMLPENISMTHGSSIHGKYIVAIACGHKHSIALDKEGQMHAWGANMYGQLGTISVPIPISISF